MSLANQSLSDLQRALRAGETTPGELLEAVIEQIDATQPTVGAYLSWDAEEARQLAERADVSKPLGGLPVLIKDNINVLGHPCTCGSRFLEQGYTAPYDAHVIERLREAGAILLGRANMDEFAMGSSTENSALGQTVNPHDPACIPGGSSGGSAAAVGAHAALAALGSDTGGSIRQPASHCGVVGLKPSYGLVSRYGLVAFASSLDQIGPLTKTVEDAARVLQVIAGYDDRDMTSVRADIPDYVGALQGGVQGMRLGVPKEFFGEGLDPVVRERVEGAIRALEAEGATLVEVSLPHSKYAVATYYIIAPAEASSNLSRFDGIRYGRRAETDEGVVETYFASRGAGFGPEVKRRIMLGTYALSSGYYDAYYTRAQKVRTLITREFEEVFRGVDAIVAPVSPQPARPLGAVEADYLADYLADVYTISANLAGIPGISVPCGVVPTERGTQLPVGLQILAPHLREDTVLRTAYAWERLHGG